MRHPSLYGSNRTQESDSFLGCRKVVCNMVEVSPFRGWRYDVSQVGDLSDVITPPYDVIDDKFQDQLYKQHPCNFIRLELNRTEPSDADANVKYARAADFLKHWKLDGVLLQEPEDAIYVYSQESSGKARTYIRSGFSRSRSIEEFGTGNVFAMSRHCRARSSID